MLVLHARYGAGDFEAVGQSIPAIESKRLLSTATRVLSHRGETESARWLEQIPFVIQQSTNGFSDDFHILYSEVPLELYEKLREEIKEPECKHAFKALAEVISEIGPYIRFVAIEMSLEPVSKISESDRQKILKTHEIDKLIYKYIGVSEGYLGNFSYQTHKEFYVNLGLDINPFDYPGTTRARFIAILSEAVPEVQAKILEGVLEKFPAGSSDLRSDALYGEIRSWISRLRGAPAVQSARPSITTDTVNRAMADAELLIQHQGATSGVDRVHTAFHGFLKAVCDDSGIPTSDDPNITELLALLRDHHPAFSSSIPRSDDIRQIIRSLSTIVNTLNPLRNRASVAHPNENLLAPPEAMLVINAVRTLLHYIDAKIRNQ